MLILGTVIHSYTPIPELLFVLLACVFVYLSKRRGASIEGAYLIGYSMAVLLHLVLWGMIMTLSRHDHLQDPLVFFSKNFQLYPISDWITSFLAYWIIPWPAMLVTQALLPAKAPRPAEDESRFYCIECSYCLTGVLTSACPECGRKFDPADPATITRDNTQNADTLRLFSNFKFLHQLVVGLLIAAALLLFVSSHVVITFMLPAIFVMSLLLLCVQTYLAFKVFSLRYALGHLVVAIVLSVVLFLGVVLVPLVVMKDTQRKWKM